MNKFKIGEEVILTGDCWGRTINMNPLDGKYTTHINSKHINGEAIVFKILAVNARIPVCENKFANTLLQDVQSSYIITVNDCNLLPVPKIEIRFYSNGRDVTNELSGQSRRAILNANND